MQTRVGLSNSAFKEVRLVGYDMSKVAQYINIPVNFQVISHSEMLILLSYHAEGEERLGKEERTAKVQAVIRTGKVELLHRNDDQGKQ